MDSYQINCAVVGPAACGLIGIAVCVVMKSLGIAPILTPVLMSAFSWWPTDLLYSGALIGAACGAFGAAAVISADMWRQAAQRTLLPTRP